MLNPMVSLLLLILLFSGSCTGCTKDTLPEPGETVTTEDINFSVEKVVQGLENPWGIVFLPDGRILISERGGRIRVVENGELLPQTISGVPQVFAHGQGGLLDLALHPDFAQNNFIYLTYSKPGNSGAGTALARAKLQGDQLVNFEVLFEAKPFTNATHHFGSRIVFDGNGYLYLSTGDRGVMDNAQRLDNDYGKIHRLREDGSVPPDNPFVNTPNARPSIWSYGHRNVQGMVYDQENDRLWAHEHGPKGGDELNLVEVGKNYGWPDITYGVDYSGEEISPHTTKPGMEQPVHYWVPSIAPCGMALVTSDKYPGWQGDLLIGALVQRHLARLDMEGAKPVGQERLLEGIGRVRVVTQSPDGFIYLATETPGQLLRLVPEE